MRFIRKMMAALILLVGVGTAQADNILLLNSGGWNGVPPNLPALLTGWGHTATVVTTQPASIESTAQSASGYDQVWFFGRFDTAGWNAASLQTILTTYLNNGGAVFVQSEVSCCNAAASFAQDLMNAVVSPSVLQGGATSIVHAVVVGGTGTTAVSAALGNRYAGSMMCTGTYTTAAFRDTENVLPDYQLVTYPSSGGVPAVFFDEAAMLGQTGRLLVSGDINYLLQGGGGTTAPITALGENVARMYVSILGDIPNYPACMPLAENDAYSVIAGQTTVSVLGNDYYEPATTAASSSNVTTIPVGAVPVGLTLNTDGTISVASSAALGTYTLTYQICRVSAPTECSTAKATLTITQSSTASGNVQAVPSLSQAMLMALMAGLGLLGLAAIRKKAAV